MHEWITEWYLVVTSETTQGEQIVGLDTSEILPIVTAAAVGALGIFAIFWAVRILKRALKSSAGGGGVSEYGEEYFESRGPGRDMDFAMARGEFSEEMLRAEEQALWDDYGEGEYPEDGIASIAGTEEYRAFFERLSSDEQEQEPFDPEESRKWLEEQGLPEEDLPF